jgi:hypothetical protein
MLEERGIWFFLAPPTELRTWEFRLRGRDPCRGREGCGEEGWLDSRGRRPGEARWRRKPKECRGTWNRGSLERSGNYKRDSEDGRQSHRAREVALQSGDGRTWLEDLEPNCGIDGQWQRDRGSDGGRELV